VLNWKVMTRCKSLTFLPLLLLALASCTRDPKVLAQRYVNNGNKFFAKRQYKEAAILYRSALVKDKRFGEAYYRLALADLKLSALSDAVQALRRAVELQPDNQDAATKLADLYILASVNDHKNSAQFTKDAAELAEKILAKNPDSFDGHRLRGQIAILPPNRNVPEAVKEFAAANQANPLQPELCVSYFEALVQNNQFPEAEKLAQDLIAKEKTFAPMYDYLYLQYRRQNKPEDAERLLKLKVANNPTTTGYLLQLATFYYQTRRRDDMELVMQKMSDEKTFPQGHLYAGDFFFFRLREFDRAQKEYEVGMKAFPKDKAAYEKRLVELYAATNRNADANQLLAAILKENPKDNDAIAMRAALMVTTGDRDQIAIAANDLQSLVTKAPGNHILRFNLAKALMAKGEPVQAQIQLEEAIKLRPDFIAARETLSRLYLTRTDNARALKAADDLIAIDPANLEAHLVRSSALLYMNDPEKAHKELDFITKTYPQNQDARYQLGLLATAEKDYKKAEQIFGDLYKANPKDSRGLLGVTEVLARDNHIDEAIVLADKALQAEPDRVDLKIGLANLYSRAQKYDKAIELYKAVVDKQPKSAELLFKLAETYRLKGDINLAIETFRRTSEAAPSNINPLIELGLLMDGMDRSDQAQPIYEQILKLDPGNSTALNNLAYIKAEQGNDLESALTMAQRARQNNPKSPQVADTLAWIYIKKNMSDEAIRIYKDVVVQMPESPAFHYHYGMALLQKGDKVSAKRELDTAMKDNPSKGDKAKIQSLLQNL
jgi:tetratricopeptide (TPR) repeat protein